MGSKDRKREGKKKKAWESNTNLRQNNRRPRKNLLVFRVRIKRPSFFPRRTLTLSPHLYNKNETHQNYYNYSMGSTVSECHLEHEPATLEQRSLRRHVSLGLELRAIEEGWRWVRVKFEEERLGVLGMVKCWVWMWELEVEERPRPWTGSHLVMTRKNDQTVNSSRLIYLLYEGDMDGFCESCFIFS